MAGPIFKMADLKRPKESLSPKNVGSIKPDPYSYEHRITLNSDNLEKMGMDLSDLKPGDKFHVLGHGEVTSVSQNHDTMGGKTGRAELQLKKMGLKKGSGKGGGLLGAVNKGISEANNSDE